MKPALSPAKEHAGAPKCEAEGVASRLMCPYCGNGADLARAVLIFFLTACPSW